MKDFINEKVLGTTLQNKAFLITTLLLIINLNFLFNKDLLILFVDKTEDINNFTDFLKERLGMSGNDVYDIIHEIWDNGHDTLGEMLDEETTDKIMLESENYILGK